MSSIKLSPLILFLILIAVLVISYIFGFKSNEGFVSYNKEAAPISTIMIPFYSSTNLTTKLYDNIYFDTANANLIEIDSRAYSGNVDLIGNTINSISVTPREGVPTQQYTAKITGNVVVPQTVNLSLRSPVASAFTSWVINTASTNTDKYSVIYIPFDNSTYIHILDTNLAVPTQIATYLFGSGNTGSFNKLWYKTANTTPLTNLTSSIKDNDPNNSKMINEPMYSTNNQVYQIGKYVKFDLSNANLIIQNGDGIAKSLTVYDRNGNAGASVTSNTQNVSTFNPYTIIDACGQNLVLYMGIGTKTVVALLQYNSSNKQFSLGNVLRVDGNRAITRDSGSSGSGNRRDDNDYWGNGHKSSDYILKTQIVPPVCPACPACTLGTMCTNCGGRGGSGTLGGGGDSMVVGTNAGGAISNVSGDIASTAKTGIVTGGLLVAGAGIEAGVLAHEAGTGATHLARDAASGTANFVEKAASGTANFAKDAATGTVGLAKEAVGGTVGLAKETVGGAVNLAKEAGAGVAGILGGKGKGDQGGGEGQGQGQGGYGNGQTPSMGTQNQYNDQYSYYGTLPAKKPSSFMPITADFSAFGK